ncbi:MAG: RNA-binding cell elongation regulator Jag/EloR [Bacillota bacterium]
MDSVKTTGKTKEEAIRYALARLGVNREDVEIEILQEPKKGFLGLGSKEAIIKAFKKETDNSIDEKIIDIEKTKEKLDIKKSDEKVEKKKDSNNNKSKEKQKDKKKNKVNESKKLNKSEKETEDVSVIDEAKDFLNNMLIEIGIDANLNASLDEENLYIDIEGNDMALVIGRRGQTLDSLQYLTSLAINRGKNDYTRILLDAENYRDKRKKTLQNLARRLAKKAKKKKRDVVLEPMNPYERRIIHSTLQGVFGINTKSKGKDPYRKVVICYTQNFNKNN